ncbi:unnamed protein product [Onchocerca flexuosa]|uniref:Uncharacterized protein n=1 Tax=Onchocerca flexuosa TaxID=387005 RepID=A0A183H7F8_9BILA|nr:unnamed protein product [Onchocerca flexuosa]
MVFDFFFGIINVSVSNPYSASFLTCLRDTFGEFQILRIISIHSSENSHPSKLGTWSSGGVGDPR